MFLLHGAVKWPNDPDHRPGARRDRHGTEALSPGSVHPFLFGGFIVRLLSDGRR